MTVPKIGFDEAPAETKAAPVVALGPTKPTLPVPAPTSNPYCVSVPKPVPPSVTATLVPPTL